MDKQTFKVGDEVVWSKSAETDMPAYTLYVSSYDNGPFVVEKVMGIQEDMCFCGQHRLGDSAQASWHDPGDGEVLISMREELGHTQLISVKEFRGFFSGAWFSHAHQ